MPVHFAPLSPGNQPPLPEGRAAGLARLNNPRRVLRLESGRVKFHCKRKIELLLSKAGDGKITKLIWSMMAQAVLRRPCRSSVCLWRS